MCSSDLDLDPIVVQQQRDRPLGNEGRARHRVQDLTVLFQKYGQTPTAKTTGAQGVGLGLYVTQLLAEAHGGRVSAESVGPGRGATFQLVLPVRRPKGAA